MTDEIKPEPTAESANAGNAAPQAEPAAAAELHLDAGLTGMFPQPPADQPLPPQNNSVLVYGAIAATLGVLLGLAFAVLVWRPAGDASSYDMGFAASDADGLTGHLLVNWNQRAGYHIVVAPRDPTQSQGFSLAVGSAPHPLSVDIQIKDTAGAVLCGKTILLKFDPRQAAALDPSDGSSQARAANASAARIAQALDIAQAETQELDREHGQDVFQNDTGKDGVTASITAQGELPCTKEAFDRAASWSFAPKFLTLDEQAALVKRQVDMQTLAGGSPAGDSTHEAASAPRKRGKKNAPPVLEAFAIEGDDELVGFDASRGVIETSMRRFFVDKMSGGVAAVKWQDVPANIHYRCDFHAACTLTRSGAAVLYARLGR
jgi:hypothetical protein